MVFACWTWSLRRSPRVAPSSSTSCSASAARSRSASSTSPAWRPSSPIATATRSTWSRSLLLNGVIDPVGGAALRTALEPLAKPMGKHDYRDRKQRLADALVELATGGGKVKVQMQVTSSIETLLGLLGSPGAETEFSLPIS